MYIMRFFAKLVLVSIFLLGMISSVHAVCDYGNADSCPVFTSDEFNIEVEGGDFKEYNVEIYDFISNNQFQTNQTQVEDTFKYPGVYEVTSYPIDQAGNTRNTNKQKFVFDNSKPLPPVVDGKISGNFSVSVPYKGDEVVIKNSNGEILTTQQATNSNEIEINSLSHQGYIELYTKRNNLVSDPTRKFYHTAEASSQNQLANGIQLNRDEMRKANQISVSNSKERNFYVEGTAQGEYVIVNGQKVALHNGQFGVFIPLNDGTNTIEVLGANQETISYNINYNSEFFHFQQISVEKLIDSSSSTIQGKTSTNKPFLVYVDGNYYQNITPQNGEFSFQLSNLQQDKTYLQLKGYDGADYETYIYKDQSAPTIESLHSSTLNQKEEMAFLIKDDLGVKDTSISLEINGDTYTYSDFTKKGNFYTFPMKWFSSGEYEYQLTIEDRFGKIQTITDKIKVNDKLVPQNFSISGQGVKAEKIGNQFFFSKQSTITMELSMEEPFAFKHIYVDGYDQTNYEIFSDNSMKLEISSNDLNQQGNITFIYVNSDKEEFEKTYSYQVIPQPSVELESLSTSVVDEKGNYNSMAGEISHKKFLNTNSVKINGVKPLWFGKDFETYNKKNKEIKLTGYDILQRPISLKSTNTNVLKQEQTLPEKTLQEESSKRLNLDYSSSNVNQLLFIDSLSYKDFQYTAIVSNSEFSSNQEGLQAVPLNGKGNSGKELSTYLIQSVDNTKPQVYKNTQNNKTRIILDGTLSPISVNSVNFGQTSTSNCEETNFQYQQCYLLENNSIEQLELSFADEAGNEFNQQIEIENLPELNQTSSIEPKLYLTGNDKTTTKNLYYIQGNYIADTQPESISTTQGECEYDEYNFICMINLSVGENPVEVSLTTQDETTIKKNWTIEKPQVNESIELDTIQGDESVYSFGGIKYYFGGDVDLLGETSTQGPVVIEINGRPTYFDNSNEQFVQDLEKELSYESQDVEDKLITLQAKTKDEEGREIKSDKLRIMYSKLQELLVSIIFE